MKFFEKQWKLVSGVLLVGVIVGGVFALWSTMSLQKEKAAQESYFTVEKKLLDLKAKQAAPKEAGKDTTKDVVDFSQTKKDLEKVISDYPNSVAAQMAAIHLAKLLINDKDFVVALATLQKVENKGTGLVNTLVQQQIGHLLVDNNKCQEAITIWQKILDRKQAAFIHNEIKIQQALCYTKLNDFKKAEEILTNLANQSVNPEIGDATSSKEAEKYLRLIQFKKASGT